MDKGTLKKAVRESRIFAVGSSFLFAAQIPDDLVGCSGSRCSNCNGAVAYCQQRCKHCGFPFVGPFGFPQITEWQALSPSQKRTMAEDMYAHRSKRGRLEYVDIKFIPLNPWELGEIERMSDRDAEYFLSAHGIDPKKIRVTLFPTPL